MSSSLASQSAESQRETASQTIDLIKVTYLFKFGASLLLFLWDDMFAWLHFNWKFEICFLLQYLMEFNSTPGDLMELSPLFSDDSRVAEAASIAQKLRKL